MQEQGSRQGDTPADEAARLATTAARQEGDAPAAPAASRPRRPSPGRVAAAAVVGALSVALIAVSAFFLFSPANMLGHLNLSTHTSQRHQPLRKPGKHASHANTRHCLRTEKSYPRHVRNII